MAKNTQIQKVTAADLELAAKESAGEVASIGGSAYFSTKSGVLAFDGAPVPDNQMAVVVLNHTFMNVYYKEDYDPDNTTPPDCYAFGSDLKTMGPGDDVEEKQNDTCQGCPMNEWGSGKGRGKACGNKVRVQLISAGNLENGRFKQFTDADHFTSAPVGLLNVPVTSVTGFAAYVKQLANSLSRPTWAVFTKVRVVPDAKSQFKVTFEPITQVPNELLGVLKARVTDAKSEAKTFAFVAKEDAPAPAAKGKRGAKKKY